MSKTHTSRALDELSSIIDAQSQSLMSALKGLSSSSWEIHLMFPGLSGDELSARVAEVAKLAPGLPSVMVAVGNLIEQYDKLHALAATISDLGVDVGVELVREP
jgi:hypothetical protein